MNPGSGLTEPSVSGNTLRPYLRRKKSSFGETKVAVIGTDGVGKSGKAIVKIYCCVDHSYSIRSESNFDSGPTHIKRLRYDIR